MRFGRFWGPTIGSAVDSTSQNPSHVVSYVSQNLSTRLQRPDARPRSRNPTAADDISDQLWTRHDMFLGSLSNKTGATPPWRRVSECYPLPTLITVPYTDALLRAWAASSCGCRTDASLLDMAVFAACASGIGVENDLPNDGTFLQHHVRAGRFCQWQYRHLWRGQPSVAPHGQH